MTTKRKQDRARAYRLKLHSQTAQSKYDNAIHVSIKILNDIGEGDSYFPRNPGKHDLTIEMLCGKNNNYLLEEPPLVWSQKVAVILEILASLVTNANLKATVPRVAALASLCLGWITHK